MDVGAPGVAAGELAAALVAFADGAAQRRGGQAVPPADVEQVAVVIVQHPGDRRVTGEGLRGGGADSRAVVEVAASRVRGLASRQAGLATPRAGGPADVSAETSAGAGVGLVDGWP